MKPQSYSNHSRLVPMYHGFVFLIILACLVFSVINVFKQPELQFADMMFLAISVVLLFMFFFARMFALRAQDRAIRAEESLRYFILTGKRLDTRLTIQQIIALRFAPDEEFPALADKAAKENTAPKLIKQSIKNWKSDNYRV